MSASTPFQPPPKPMGAGAPSVVLIFLKSLATPVVLYAENPAQLYDEIRQMIQQAKSSSPKLVEKPGTGPLKKVSFLDTELAGVALQADPSAAGPAAGNFPR